MTDLTQHALGYAMRGYEVFPLGADKAPYPKSRGFNDGTTDIIAVEKWWNDKPESLIGHRVPKDVVILDIDPRHGGLEVWNALEQSYSPIPITKRHHSGRGDGGFHAWFKRPDIARLTIKELTEWAIRNNVAHQLDDNTLTCGIDILTHNLRYTILPPSIHPETGRPYEWDDQGEPGDMPGFLIELLTPPPPPPPKPRAQSQADSPADWYSETATWAEVLNGWTCVHGTGDDDGSLWRHPNASAPHSASIKHGCLFVYTPNTPFEQTEESGAVGYTRFRALAIIHHDGNMSAAARAAKEMRDSGKQPTPPPPDPYIEPEAEQPAEIGTDWGAPVALGEYDRPAFPLHALPDWIAQQARQAAVEMQLTPDLAAQLAITALSVISAGRAHVRVRGPWIEGTNTYLVTALPPSTGKSPTFGMMLNVLDQWEDDLGEHGAKDAEDRELDRRHLEKMRDEALKKGEVSQAKMHADDLREIPPIHPPRLMADDVTPEKLAELMAEQNGRMALVSTEGGLFGMMTGRYSDKANLDVYLGSWSGDVIRVDRVERGTLVVRNPRLSVGLTVQPDVIARVGKNKELVGRGLTARFMYVIPADTVGNRSKSRDTTYCMTIAERYNRKILSIAHGLPEIGGDVRTLELSPEARRLFNAWQDDREQLLKPFGELRYMAEWVAKCDSTTARLAALLHIADGDESNSVSAETIERAILVGDYWTAHAKAAFDLMGSSDDLGHARYILGWLQSRTNEATITFREVTHGGAKRRVESTSDLAPAFDILVENGWLKPTFDGPLLMAIGRGKTSPEFEIHPSLVRPHLPPLPPLDSESGQIDHGERQVGAVGAVGLEAPESYFSTNSELQRVDVENCVPLPPHPNPATQSEPTTPPRLTEHPEGF